MNMKKEYYPDTRAFAFADDVIHEHIASMMHCTGSYEPKDEDELKDFMIDECAQILMDNFKKGEYTPLEFNDIRNALAIRINGFFAIGVEEDDDDGTFVVIPA